MRWAEDLARPVPLAATGLLVANDHWWKSAGLLPSTITGKLSDVAGLFVAGVLAVCLVRGLGGRRIARDGACAALALLTVGIAFAALKAWPAYNALVNRVWGHHALDVTDLLALPVLLLAWVWLGDRQRAADGHAPGRFGTAAALIGVVLACAATAPPRPVPPRPVAAWVVDTGMHELGCARVAAVIVKSGKTGFALNVFANPTTSACTVAVEAARVRFPGGDVIAGRPVALPPPHARYVIFELDNERRWNRGERAATIELDLRVAAHRHTWTLPARHVYVQFPLGHR